jgi:hypothetical protein
MDNEIVKQDAALMDISADILDSIIIEGDLSKLTQPQRIEYHNEICKRVGIDPATRPFDYIKMNNKLVLYANKSACEQLRRKYNVSVTNVKKETIGNIFTVTVMVKDYTGRTDCGMGAVDTTNLKGEAMANAYLKCETKAKRRATLSICGLGMLDESEVASVKAVDCSVSETSNAKHLLNSKQNEIESKSELAKAIKEQLGGDFPDNKAHLAELVANLKQYTGIEDFNKLAETVRDQLAITFDISDEGGQYHISERVEHE